MPIDFTINKDVGIVIAVISGSITDRELYQAYHSLYTSEQWKPGYHEIVYFNNANMVGTTKDGMVRLSGLVNQHTQDACDSFKTALICPQDLTFGMCNIYEAYSHSSPEVVQIFRTAEPALEWMGIEESGLGLQKLIGPKYSV